MFAVPLVSLVALYAFSAFLTVPNAINDHNYSNSDAAETSPAARALSVDLPTERADTYTWLLSGGKASKAPLLTVRAAVTKELPSAETAFHTGEDQLTAANKVKLNAVLSAFGQISAIRTQVDAGRLTPAAAFSAYSNILDTQFSYYGSSIVDRGGTQGVISVGALDAYYSLEMASREAALVDGAFAGSKATMSPAVRELFISSAANRQRLLAEATNLLTGDLVAGYNSFINSATYKQFNTMEAEIGASSGNGPLPVNAKTWETVSGAYLGGMAQIQEANGVRLTALGASLSDRLVTEAVLAGGVGLLAVVVSMLLLAWFGRKVTGDLTRLYASVRGMAEERLPRVVERLRRGDDVDVLAESPPPEAGSIEEIAQIARSFGIVQEAAVAAAVEQAQLRKGVNQVFLNISMRNQSLLHRQLGMLDSMERGTSEPGALADLFRLDHLTTRMRRHAEGLIILSGSTPGRGWRDPVPVVDVLRAAVAEVEDYVRVDVLSESRDLVAGNAVNDVIHLVAELVENATVFSPPNTRIEVRADRAGTGLVAEVEDRGLGLSPEELTDINRRLANPPEFDLANSEQLGLFVVSRLAARHSIKVSLRQSVYGGTTAILVLPFGVIVREEEAGLPASQGDWPADGQGPGGADSSEPLSPFGVTGRHRLAAAATGRRADTDATGRDEEDRPAAPRPLPRAPWEYARTEAQGPAPVERPLRDAETSAPWPDAFSRPPVGWGTDRTSGDALASPPGVRRGQQTADMASSGSHLGMPIRVPQASLAPQLRADRESGQQAAGSATPEVDARSPEVTRNMMILMQQGWERGRVDDLDDPAGASDHGTDR